MELRKIKAKIKNELKTKRQNLQSNKSVDCGSTNGIRVLSKKPKYN